MATKAQNIKLGIFVVGALVVLAVALALVSGRALFEDQEIYYVISERTVAGLEVGAAVNVRGVRAGRVRAIELDEKDYDRVVVTIAVDSHVPIPRGAEAQFLLEGLTGRRIIDITGGSLEVGVIPPGGVIPRGVTPIEQIEERAVALAEEAVAVANQGDELLGNLARLTGDLSAEDVRELLERTSDLMGQLTSLTGELEGALEENRPALRRAIASTARSAERAEELFREADLAVTELRTAVGAGGALIRANATEVSATLDNLREASRNLQELSRELRLRPSKLLFSRPPKERELP